MRLHEYIQECKLLLQAFEITQETMLRLNLPCACDEFQVEMNGFRALFNEMSVTLRQKEDFSPRRRVLLTKQIERLNKFLKEMNGLISGCRYDQNLKETHIIFVFERQHLFKNILRRHLKDMAA